MPESMSLKYEPASEPVEQVGDELVSVNHKEMLSAPNGALHSLLLGTR